MKNFFILAAVALLATACTSDNDQLVNESAVTNQAETVTLTFTPYDMEAMTRTATMPDGFPSGATRAATAALRRVSECPCSSGCGTVRRFWLRHDCR